MGQKAQAAQRAFEARGMSPAKALRRALARTADVLWDLALVCHGVQLERLDQDGVIDRLSEEGLIILLDSPDGVIGLAEVDREVLTGIVEVQTIQQVTTMPIDDRPLTPTDAAMMAPMLDGTLSRFPLLLEDSPLRPQVEGYRFGAMVEDKRGVGMILDAAAYRAYHATVDLAVGRRRGKLSFYLPERVIAKPKTEDNAPVQGPHAAVMMRLPATLDCILAELTISLARAKSLKPGDLLLLPEDCKENVSLYAAKGTLVGRGSLGQQNGQRALRITWPPGAGGGGSGGGAGAAAMGGAAALAAPLSGVSDDEGGFDMGGSMDMDGLTGGEDADPMAEFGGDEALPDLPEIDAGGDELADMDFGVDFDAGGEGEDGGFDAGTIDFDID